MSQTSLLLAVLLGLSACRASVSPVNGAEASSEQQDVRSGTQTATPAPDGESEVAHDGQGGIDPESDALALRDGGATKSNVVDAADVMPDSRGRDSAEDSHSDAGDRAVDVVDDGIARVPLDTAAGFDANAADALWATCSDVGAVVPGCICGSDADCGFPEDGVCEKADFAGYDRACATWCVNSPCPDGFFCMHSYLGPCFSPLWEGTCGCVTSHFYNCFPCGDVGGPCKLDGLSAEGRCLNFLSSDGSGRCAMPCDVLACPPSYGCIELEGGAPGAKYCVPLKGTCGPS
jgi:hypothetical protein